MHLDLWDALIRLENPRRQDALPLLTTAAATTTLSYSLARLLGTEILGAVRETVFDELRDMSQIVSKYKCILKMKMKKNSRIRQRS